VRPSIAAALLVVILAGYLKVTTGSYHAGEIVLAMLAVCLPGLSHIGWRWRKHGQGAPCKPRGALPAGLRHLRPTRPRP
jgi:hypothetical protein